MINQNLNKSFIPHVIQRASLLGKRESNEDKEIIIINLDGSDSKINQINFCSIFDGHGGGGVSKFMKDNLHNYFVHKHVDSMIKNNKKFNKYTQRVFDMLQKKLINDHPQLSKRCGSTSLSTILFHNNNKLNLWGINLGDCRAILCNKYNIPIPLTKDHKPNSIEERNRITQLGGKIKFDGYDWRIGDLSVSRSMGDTDNTPYVTHLPEIFKYTIHPDDKFIVMGCDGLWDVLDNQEVVNFILEYLNQSNGILKNDSAKFLADLAIRSGSTDNVSVIVQFLQP
jgi:serine/threonine protein phosphatase PrpC